MSQQFFGTWETIPQAHALMYIVLHKYEQRITENALFTVHTLRYPSICRRSNSSPISSK